MKHSIKALFICGLLALGISHVAMAKDCDRPRAEKRMERLTERLNLNEEQATLVRGIFDEQREKFQAIKADTDEQLAEVLSEEQLSQLHKRRKSKGH